jgi:hypothetical protein
MPLLILSYVWGDSSNHEKASNVMNAVFFKTTLGHFGDYQTAENPKRTTI